MIDKALIDTYRAKGMYVSVWGIPDEETLANVMTLSPDAVEW